MTDTDRDPVREYQDAEEALHNPGCDYPDYECRCPEALVELLQAAYKDGYDAGVASESSAEHVRIADLRVAAARAEGAREAWSSAFVKAVEQGLPDFATWCEENHGQAWLRARATEIPQ